MLFQQTIHILHLHARTIRDAPLAGAIDSLRKSTLIRCHGMNNGNLALELLFICHVFERTRINIARYWQFFEHRADAAHAQHLFELVP